MFFTIGCIRVKVVVLDEKPLNGNGLPRTAVRDSDTNTIELWRGIPRANREVSLYHEWRHFLRDRFRPADDEESDCEHYGITTATFQQELRRQGGITAFHRLFEPERAPRRDGRGWSNRQKGLWKEACNAAGVGKVDQERILALCGKPLDDGAWSSTAAGLNDKDFARCMAELEKLPFYNGQIRLSRKCGSVWTTERRWHFRDAVKNRQLARA